MIASACPFCLLMLSDGMKVFSEKEMVFDIAELVAAAWKRTGFKNDEGCVNSK